MDKQQQNIQDGFLNSARKEKLLVTVYLLPDAVNNKVQPLLDKQLKKGARIVAKEPCLCLQVPHQCPADPVREHVVYALAPHASYVVGFEYAHTDRITWKKTRWEDRSWAL